MGGSFCFRKIALERALVCFIKNALEGGGEDFRLFALKNAVEG